MENENIYNISFERSLLSSIIFEPQIMFEVEKVLMTSDFYLPAHQEIYAAMEILYKNDMPIDEEFIKRKSKKFDERAMLDILAATPIANFASYAKEVKRDSVKREIQKQTLKLQHEFCPDIIDKLQNLKVELENIDSTATFKNNDKNIMSVFDRFDIDFDEIENVKFEYLINNFLVKNEITMISALPGTGKSLLSVAVANMMLIDSQIQQVYYIDGDNSKSTLKDRNVHHLKKMHGNKFRYFVGLEKNELWQIIRTLQKIDLTNSLIVFDSIKNFIAGDRDKNKDVSPVMEILKTLRNNGATVVFLHHQNKKQKDVESDYAGSSAFAEDTSNAFTLKRNDEQNALILKPFKTRAGDLYEIAYAYNSNNHTLTKLDVEKAKQTKEMDEMIKETVDYLKSARNKPMWSELWKNLTDSGFDKEKASKIIKNNEGKLWNFERGDRNNQKLYILIENPKVVETVYEDIPNTAPRSPITPRTPIQGSFDSLEIAQDKSEKSKGVYFMPITPRTSNIGLYQGLNTVSDKSENSENLKIEIPAI